MSCDFRLSSVEKKTLQKRRAITIFDQFRLLGNVIHVMICICVVKKALDDWKIVARVLSFKLA